MNKILNPYFVLIQASPDEILEAKHPSELNLQDLKEHKNIKDVLIVLPEFENTTKAVSVLKNWGFESFVGDSYNIARRLWDANQTISEQDYIVRVLAIWKHIDLEYLDTLNLMMQSERVDYITIPKNIEITMAGDLASEEAILKVSLLDGDDVFSNRSRFNPFSSIESKPEGFKVKNGPTIPKYSENKIKEILSSKRLHPENEFFGREYNGSRYHFLERFVDEGTLVMDIACGSAFGAFLLSKKVKKVVGVDYLESYIQVAKERYKESEILEFHIGDGMNYIYNNTPEYFDTIISLHTLEHVPDDKKMLSNLYQNLKRGGRLILEIPIQMELPMGVPVNPYHFREYNVEGLHQIILEAGFEIERAFGSIRGIYVEPEKARDAYQVHAIKR